LKAIFFVHKIGVKSKRHLHKREKYPLAKMKTMKVITKSPFPTNQSINSTQPDELGQLTLIGVREGTFNPLVLFGLDFVSLIFIFWR
jgi:hypothetical protein